MTGTAVDVLTVAAAKITADGLPVIALVSGTGFRFGHSTQLSLLSPELEPLASPQPVDRFSLLGAVFTPWAGSSEQQLVALRPGSDSKFSTSVLVWGAASRLRRRTEGVADVRGTQEFKTNWTDNGSAQPHYSVVGSSGCAPTFTGCRVCLCQAVPPRDLSSSQHRVPQVRLDQDPHQQLRLLHLRRQRADSE